MAKKDLYVVFNGMFLFNWKGESKELEVFVPGHGGHTHYNFVAQSLDLTNRVGLPRRDDLTIQPLASSTNPQRFSNYRNLAISGSHYEIDPGASRAAYAKFISLPWPDEVFTPESWLVRKDNYLRNTHPSATLSPDVPNAVADIRGNPHTAIAVSEVLVLKYLVEDAVALRYDEGSIPAIESGNIQLLGVFASMDEKHAGHPHDDAFNALLRHTTTGLRPAYRPSARPADLGQRHAVPRPGSQLPIEIPTLWLESTEFKIFPSGNREVSRSASGMGSCDNGNRCEDC